MPVRPSSVPIPRPCATPTVHEGHRNCAAADRRRRWNGASELKFSCHCAKKCSLVIVTAEVAGNRGVVPQHQGHFQICCGSARDAMFLNVRQAGQHRHGSYSHAAGLKDRVAYCRRDTHDRRFSSPCGGQILAVHQHDIDLRHVAESRNSVFGSFGFRILPFAN